MCLPCSGMEAVFFHTGTEQPRSDFPNTANGSSRAPAGSKAVGLADPSSSWASDVTVCDTLSGTSPSPAGVRVPSVRGRWVQAVPGAGLREQRCQRGAKAQLQPQCPALPSHQPLLISQRWGLLHSAQWMSCNHIFKEHIGNTALGHL